MLDADDALAAVVSAHQAWIMGEVLATELTVGPTGADAATVTVDGQPVRVESPADDLVPF